MRTNKKSSASVVVTHEGGRAYLHQKPEEELTRAVSTCLLWEDTFYEKGSEIASRIEDLCTKVPGMFVANLAREARTSMKLRHVPLFLALQLVKAHSPLAKQVIIDVVQRPDEMTELLAMYWRDGRKPLAAQLKKGLAAAFTKFNKYNLAKWNKDETIKLRDVMFMVHPKPLNPEMAGWWKDLVDGKLETPDTWEVALSSGKDKCETWTRLLQDKKLGYMALLMNLRNMSEAGVNPHLVENALRVGAKDSKALPFRFVSAYKYAPQYGQVLSDAMELAVTGHLDGSTALLLDVSGSMNAEISGKSKLLRYEAAAALAILVRSITPQCRVFTYDTDCREVANIKGLGMVDAIRKNVGGGTNTRQALRHVETVYPNVHRVILLTDEQAHDGIHRLWAKHGYIINVAPYKPSLDTDGGWVRINGWSERVVEFIQSYEQGGIQ